MEKNFNGAALANKPFGAKKALLQKSKVFLDPVIENATEWTEAEIAKRAKWLAGAAFQKVWKI